MTNDRQTGVFYRYCSQQSREMVPLRNTEAFDKITDIDEALVSLAASVAWPDKRRELNDKRQTDRCLL